MTIHHHCSSDQDDTFPETPARVHARRTLEHGAHHAANLAIARWSGAPPVMAPARAAWLAKAQDGLLQWLDAGGFGQTDRAAQLPLDQLSLPDGRPLLHANFRNVGINTV